MRLTPSHRGQYQESPGCSTHPSIFNTPRLKGPLVCAASTGASRLNCVESVSCITSICRLVITLVGPLMGASQCRMSILRNGNVTYVAYFPICHMSILRNGNVTCHCRLGMTSKFNFCGPSFPHILTKSNYIVCDFCRSLAEQSRLSIKP